MQGAIRRLPAELGPVVDDFQQTALSQAPHADLYAPPLFASGDCALDAVLHQRLEEQWRDLKVIQSRLEIYQVTQFLPEPHLLNVEVLSENVKFLRQAHMTLPVGAQGIAEKGRKFFGHFLGFLRLFRDQRSNRVEGVEKKRWIDARLKRLELRFGSELEQPFFPQFLVLQSGGGGFQISEQHVAGI